MIALADHQFEILPDELSTDGVGFGIDLPISVNDDGFDTGARQWQTQDTISPTRGTRNFGRDVASGPTWAWTMFVNGDEESDVWRDLAELSTAWKAGKIIDTPGRLAVVRYGLDGRTRRIYGRPRNFSAPPNNGVLFGTLAIVADFVATDDLIYDDVQRSASVTFAASSTGGFQFPVTFPVQTLPSGANETTISVGGDEPTWGVYRFDGPLSTPVLSIGNSVRIGLTGSIEDGDWITVDTRPWALSVTRNGVYNAAGLLTRRFQFSSTKLAPGQHQLKLSAASGGSGGSVTVSWRDAYGSL